MIDILSRLILARLDLARKKRVKLKIRLEDSEKDSPAFSLHSDRTKECPDT